MILGAWRDQGGYGWYSGLYKVRPRGLIGGLWGGCCKIPSAPPVEKQREVPTLFRMNVRTWERRIPKDTLQVGYP